MVKELWCRYLSIHYSGVIPRSFCKVGNHCGAVGVYKQQRDVATSSLQQTFTHYALASQNILEFNFPLEWLGLPYFSFTSLFLMTIWTLISSSLFTRVERVCTLPTVWPAPYSEMYFIWRVQDTGCGLDLPNWGQRLVWTPFKHLRCSLKSGNFLTRWAGTSVFM